MFLLNISYVPDEIIKNLTHFNQGWSGDFCREMMQYQKNFNQNLKMKNINATWKFQDDELEHEYINYVKSVDKRRERLDKKLLRQRKEWERKTRELTILKEI